MHPTKPAQLPFTLQRLPFLASSALLAYPSPSAHSLEAGALSLTHAPARLICQTLGSWRTKAPAPRAQPRGSSPGMCARSGAESVRPRPRWEVEAVGALLTHATATLPAPGGLRAGPASTPSVRLQPWTGSLLPQKPADSPGPRLVLVCPAAAPGREATNAPQEEHRLASGCGLNLSANVSADTNAVSNPFATLSQCWRGSWVEPAF